MNLNFLEFVSLKPKRFASWHIILILSWLVSSSQMLALWHLSYYQQKEAELYDLRFFHVILALVIALGLTAFKKYWKPKYAVPLFLILIIPTYFVAWFSQVSQASHGQPWQPLLQFKLYPIFLAFLVPGPYWLNALLILGHCVEATVLWYYLDMPNLPGIVMGPEPMLTIIFNILAFTMLFFKYHDDRVISSLSKHEERNEILGELTRLFLSIRDQSNTPLQSLKITTSLIKRKCTEVSDEIELQDRSLNSLINLNKYLESSNEKLSSTDKALMNDQEIVEWINSLNKKISELDDHEPRK